MAEKERRTFGQYTKKGQEVRKTVLIDSPELLIKIEEGEKKILKD
jgi:hypothetical protein